MSVKKDQLKAMLAEQSKANTRTPEPIEPMSLDPSKRQHTIYEGDNGSVAVVASHTKDGTPLDWSGATKGLHKTKDNATTQDIQEVIAKAPKKRIVATLPKPKHGVINTSRYSFEITEELKAKLNRRVAEITLATGKKTTASEIIRQALARELREL